MKPILHMNPLLDACTSLFVYTSVFRKPHRGASVNENFRRAVMAGFDEFERKTYERKIPMQKVKEAKYALCAYIDETVLLSNWPHRMNWMSKPLQLEFFGEHIGGEGFFKHLNALRQAGDRFVDVMEVYYICLQLGFEGMYRLRGLEQLTALQVDLRSQIEGFRKYGDNRLSPMGVPQHSIVTKMRREIPYWVIGSVTAAVMFFTYLGYTIATSNYLESTTGEIVVLESKLSPDSRVTTTEPTVYQ